MSWLKHSHSTKHINSTIIIRSWPLSDNTVLSTPHCNLYEHNPLENFKTIFYTIRRATRSKWFKKRRSDIILRCVLLVQYLFLARNTWIAHIVNSPLASGEETQNYKLSETANCVFGRTMALRSCGVRTRANGWSSLTATVAHLGGMGDPPKELDENITKRLK